MPAHPKSLFSYRQARHAKIFTKRKRRQQRPKGKSCGWNVLPSKQMINAIYSLTKCKRPGNWLHHYKRTSPTTNHILTSLRYLMWFSQPLRRISTHQLVTNLVSPPCVMTILFVCLAGGEFQNSWTEKVRQRSTCKSEDPNSCTHRTRRAVPGSTEGAGSKNRGSGSKCFWLRHSERNLDLQKSRINAVYTHLVVLFNKSELFFNAETLAVTLCLHWIYKVIVNFNDMLNWKCSESKFWRERLQHRI